MGKCTEEKMQLRLTLAHISTSKIMPYTTQPNGTPANNYPPIYAIADGVISNIDTYYEVTNPQKTHYRYGIRLDFASADGQTISMSYSIEPMVDREMNPFIRILFW